MNAYLEALLFFGFIIQGFIFGFVCQRLAKYKGYDGYFLVGLFGGIIGLLYVIGLPLRKDNSMIL